MKKILKPQPGPQERFLSTAADVCIYGGAAGGGKSYGLLLTPLRYKNVPGFGCTIFRKNYNQIFAQGGLWENTLDVYSGISGAVRKKGEASWYFYGRDGQQGGKITFAHIERYEEVSSWQGSQICELCCEVGTPVLMADGTYKPVGDITVGDIVQTLNGAWPVVAVGHEKEEECVDAVVNGKKQVQTIDHKLLTVDGWMSYEDIIHQEMDIFYCSCETILSHFLSTYGEPYCLRHSDAFLLLQNLCEGLRRTREASEEHLRSSDIESLLGHIASELLLFLSSGSTEYDCVSEHERCFQQSIQELRKHLGSLYLGQMRNGEVSLKNQGYQDLPETSAYMALPSQESYSELFLLKRRESLLRVLIRLQKVLDEQVQRLSLENGKSGQARDESSCARSEKRSEDFQWRYYVCRDLCGECIRLFQGIFRETARQLNGVVLHNPNGLHPYGMGRTQEGNGRVLRYVHPRIESLHFQAEERVSFCSCSLSPCGKKKVRNITVSVMNYYITDGGFVNKNCFDELTHFEEKTFFYMLSRNRSTCGVKPFVRATCNPDSSSWVADFISWWIDQDTGYPIPERSGKIRWFIRREEEIYWADTRRELWERFNLTTPEEKEEPRSVTFIASSIYDNKELLRVNPQYLANLKALATVERERLLNGNWKIKPAAGLYFKREQLGNIIEVIPDDVVKWVRCWDLAATEKDEKGDPAYTAGVLMGKRKNGRYVIADVINKQMAAADVRKTILLTAQMDRARFKNVRIRIPQDPGQAGKEQAGSYIKYLAGFDITAVPETGSKVERAVPMAAQWQAGNFDLVYAPWNESYLLRLENFPDGKFKDMVDASANGFTELELRSQFSLRNFL